MSLVKLKIQMLRINLIQIYNHRLQLNNRVIMNMYHNSNMFMDNFKTIFKIIILNIIQIVRI